MKKGSLQNAARVALAEPVRVDTLRAGNIFETLHTKRFGKVVECLSGPDEVGVLVKLYTLGDGWIEKYLHCSCPVRPLG